MHTLVYQGSLRTVKDKGHSFKDNIIHILDTEDRWFERGVKEVISVEVENPSPNSGGGLQRHISSTYNALLSSLPRRFNFHPH